MKEKTRRRLKVTHKQKEARQWVDDWIDEHGYPPTYRDVAFALALSSPNTSYARLRGYRHKMVKKNKP